MRYLTTEMPDRAALLPSPDEVYQLIASLGLPQHVGAYGIGEPELRRAATELGGKYPADDLARIYLSAL
jgi:hypothetical protein